MPLRFLLAVAFAIAGWSYAQAGSVNVSPFAVVLWTNGDCRPLNTTARADQLCGDRTTGTLYVCRNPGLGLAPLFCDQNTEWQLTGGTGTGTGGGESLQQTADIGRVVNNAVDAASSVQIGEATRRILQYCTSLECFSTYSVPQDVNFKLFSGFDFNVQGADGTAIINVDNNTKVVTFAQPIVGSVTGNAGTATSLVGPTQDCPPFQVAISIDNAGNLTCVALTDAFIPDTGITLSSYLPKSAGGAQQLTGQLFTSNLGIEYQEGDTNPGCFTGNYNTYADQSEHKLKKCEDGNVSDLDLTGAGSVDTISAASSCVDVGSSDAYACNMNPIISSYQTNTRYWIKAATANTAPGATLQLNGIVSIKNILKLVGGVKVALVTGDVQAGQWMALAYDGTDMVLINPTPSLQSVYNLSSPPTIQVGAAGLKITDVSSLAKSYQLCGDTGCTATRSQYYDSGTSSWITTGTGDLVTTLASTKNWILEQSTGTDILKVTEAGIFTAETAATVNFGSATATSPAKMGTTPPGGATCLTGQIFFDTDAPVTSNLLTCFNGAWSAQGTSAVLTNDSVTNAFLANMAQGTIKGRSAASGTGDPEDLIGSQVNAILPSFNDTTRGIVPASGGGTVNFLRADGNWAPPTTGAFLPLAGGTMTGTLTLNSITSGFPLADGAMVYDSDFDRLRIGSGPVAAIYSPVLTHATNCTNGTVSTKVIGDRCVDQDDGKEWICKDPTQAGNSAFCDAVGDWLGVQAGTAVQIAGTNPLNCTGGTDAAKGIDNFGAAEGCFDVLSQGEFGTFTTAIASIGTVNTVTNPLDWSQLKNVPSDIADGDQIGGTGSADVNSISAATSCADSGSNDNYVCSITPIITSYQNGTRYWVKANTLNTGPATIALNGLTPVKGLRKLVNNVKVPLVDGDVQAGQWMALAFDSGDSSNMLLLNPTPNLQNAYNLAATTANGTTVNVDVNANGIRFRDLTSSTKAFWWCGDLTCINYVKRYFDGGTGSWITETFPASDATTTLPISKSFIVEQGDGDDLFKITEAGVISAEPASAVDFSSSSNTVLCAESAGAAPTNDNECAWDTTTHRLKYGENGTSRTVAWTSDLIADDQTLQDAFNQVGGKIIANANSEANALRVGVDLNGDGDFLDAFEGGRAIWYDSANGMQQKDYPDGHRYTDIPTNFAAIWRYNNGSSLVEAMRLDNTTLKYSNYLRPLRSVEVPTQEFGACSYTEAIVSAGKPKVGVLTCSTATSDGFDFNFMSPDNWDANTLKVKLNGFSTTTQTGNLVMTCVAQAVRDGDLIGARPNPATFGQTVTLGFVTGEKEESATSAAITVQGTPAAGAHIYGTCTITSTTGLTMTNVRISAVPKVYFTITQLTE